MGPWSLGLGQVKLEFGAAGGTLTEKVDFDHCGVNRKSSLDIKLQRKKCHYVYIYECVIWYVML